MPLPIESASLVISAAASTFAPTFLFVALLGFVIRAIFGWFRGGN